MKIDANDINVNGRKADYCEFHHEYDYIIIGSGPAGSVLAKELSDNKKPGYLLD